MHGWWFPFAYKKFNIIVCCLGGCIFSMSDCSPRDCGRGICGLSALPQTRPWFGFGFDVGCFNALAVVKVGVGGPHRLFESALPQLLLVYVRTLPAHVQRAAPTGSLQLPDPLLFAFRLLPTANVTSPQIVPSAPRGNVVRIFFVGVPLCACGR